MPLLQVGTQAPSYMMIGTFGLVFVIFYFFIIRPQNKKQKETEKMISAVKKGDKVITIGGIHGEVTSTKEKSVIVKVDEACKIEFSRTAIATVVVDEKAEKPVKNDRFAKKSADGSSKADESSKSEENK